MSLDVNHAADGQKWHVIFRIKPHASKRFHDYCRQEPTGMIAYTGTMRQVDEWAEMWLCNLMQQFPDAHFSYRVEHW